MCRWFAYISAEEPCLLDTVLIAPKHSIVKQVNEHYLPGLYDHKKGISVRDADVNARNIYFNQDGFGVAWYSNTQEEFSGGKIKGPRPQLYRTIQPPLNEPDFHSFCKNSSSLCVLAHIRMATGVVHLYNNHPFQFGRHLLQHNGSVAHFDQIRLKLCEQMSAKALLDVRGSADSEHVAGLYMTYLGEDWEMQYSVEEMKTALFKTIDTIIRLQLDVKPTQTEPSSLNICVTDGEQLVGIRFRNVEGNVHQPPSLYYSTTAGSTLNPKFPGPLDQSAGNGPSKPHGKHVIVSSEPTTDEIEDNWKLVEKNEAVIVGKDMEVKLEAIPVVAAFKEPAPEN